MPEHTGYDPEYPYTTSPPPARPPRKPVADVDGAAIAGFIMVFFIAPAGFILGAVSQSQAKRHGMRPSGLATAAIVLGALFTVIETLILAVIIAAAIKSGQQPCDLSNPDFPNC